MSLNVTDLRFLNLRYQGTDKSFQSYNKLSAAQNWHS